MILDTFNKVRDLFRSRSFAYVAVFGNDKDVYVKLVLKDLAKFCRAHETTYDPDERKHLMLEGRKEVWLRIQNYLRLNSEELFELHKIKDLPREK